jgi:hypothetical protein
MYTISFLETEQIDELLELQKNNLIQNLNNVTNDGFLTFTYDKELITNMMHHMPQPVILFKGKIVGYALAAAKEVCIGNPLLKPLIDIGEELIYNNKKIAESNYYTIGQICIDKNHRGKKLFEKLYQTHKNSFGTDYDLVITEISQLNQKSQYKHESIGFKTIHQFTQGSTNWNVVLWDFQN